MQRDLFHIERGRTQKALLQDLRHTTHPSVTMAMQFLAVGKAAFNRFLASGIDGLATLRQTVGVDAFPTIFPYVARDDSPACLAGRAFLKKLACFANLRVRGVFTVARPVGGPIAQEAVCRTNVAIH